MRLEALWLLCAALLSAAEPARTSALDDLRVGHFVELKGELRDDGLFHAESVSVLQPAAEEELVGTPARLLPGGAGFELLGHPVRVSARTEWEGVTLAGVLERQVKVEGHYRGPGKFSAREVSARREPGRERLTGRVDALRRVPGGLELLVMGRDVRVADEVAIEFSAPVEQLELAPARAVQGRLADRDDDDDLPAELELIEGVTFGGQLELRSESERDVDLDETAPGNERTRSASFRGQLIWEPSAEAYALLGFRTQYDVTRDREPDEPTDRERDDTLTEAYAYLRDPFGWGVDLQVGRQDFDEQREWLYDQNLDAVRAIWAADDLRVELSASTVLADGGRRDRESHNYILYVSNNDEDRHLAAYVVDRRRDGEVFEKPIHFGARALGEWFEDHQSWLELSALRGYDATHDFRGWAVDLGTTWEPPALAPFYFTAGLAHGSGDDDPDDDVDGAFRQTGLHDNNARFGGVTSFRYYGELVDPELSNLTVLTAGVGARLGERSSLDLVVHDYRQDVAADRLRDTSLDARPTGESRDLGRGVDLVFGSRGMAGWDLEVVLGAFRPGAAFVEHDEAWLTKFQARYRF